MLDGIFASLGKILMLNIISSNTNSINITTNVIYIQPSRLAKPRILRRLHKRRDLIITIANAKCRRVKSMQQRKSSNSTDSDYHK